MLIVLSPAKTLDFTSPFGEIGTTARFAGEARKLAQSAAALPPERLAALMHISPRLAALTAQRFASFNRAPQRPAIRAFAGDVYRGFDAASASAATIAFAQDHLRILSGLYGAVRPLDKIRPHRLEMGTRWSPGGERLLDHWGPRIATSLAVELRRQSSTLLVNLASKEYFAAVGPHLPAGITVVTPEFRVATKAGLRFDSFAAKVARGALARFACERRAVDQEQLQEFTGLGWSHDPAGSSPNSPLFVRY